MPGHMNPNPDREEQDSGEAEAGVRAGAEALGRGSGRGRMYGMPGRAGWMQFYRPGWVVPTCQPGTVYPYSVFQEFLSRHPISGVWP